VGTCKTCFFPVNAGEQHLSPLTGREREELVWIRCRHPDVPMGQVRLACLATVSDDVTIYSNRVRSDADTCNVVVKLAMSGGGGT
jgi:hypothetical protein